MNGSIPGTPDWGRDPVWPDFARLVDFRNGLVHGRASRPDSSDLLPRQRPEPTVEQLELLQQGWAVEVVAGLIKSLHRAVGTAPPSWLS